ncbi:glycoside hydrolase family 172 protein [Flammeovirgaceae bacterium SG7u.111]|nr:glycoside hydrolase family 172 protein [Flammeovirgaceae bacterium SG7u.132]WPO33867.1 glycoside hydrolase family 172 protein [Flammeovirgaceae bacterium SG7u.111]
MKNNYFIILSALFLCTFLFSCKEEKGKVSIESLLAEMVDRDAITRFPATDFRLKQASSYNRASVTPEDTVGWFINHDFNSNEKDHNFIRIEEENGQKEWVLMDHEGPGAIVRTWMPFLKPDKPNADIEIKIYLDGAEEPTLQGNMLGLLNGDGLIPYPFAHKSLRSAVSFFPIPYAKRCKITTTGRPFFYQFTYREYVEGTSVETFTLNGFNAAAQLTEKVGKKLLNPENVLMGEEVTMKAKLGASEEKSIQLPQGVAAVRRLSLKLANYDSASVTRSVVLKMSFDGKQTVWCPIGDFFGTGIGLNPYQGWHNTVLENGIMNSRWVMPYQKMGSIAVENLGEKEVEVELRAVVGDYNWTEQSLYFNAAWRGQYPVSTRPFSDWNYVTLQGRGVYVGDALTVMNPVEKWWGEGDEKIWVDGEDFPSIFGTGTEDYYGYSWGGRSTDFYEHSFHAQPRCNVYNKLNRKTSKERSTLGYSTETRTRALDGMPFGSSFQLDMEIWSWTDCEMGYGVGMMWYGDASTTTNRLPDANEALNVPQLAEKE